MDLLVLTKIYFFQIKNSFRNLNFQVIEFQNKKPEIVSNDLKPDATLAYILKRYSSLFVLFFHIREVSFSELAFKTYTFFNF